MMLLSYLGESTRKNFEDCNGQYYSVDLNDLDLEHFYQSYTALFVPITCLMRRLIGFMLWSRYRVKTCD